MKQEQKGWTEGKPGEGVFVKKSEDFYAFAPLHAFSDDSGLYQSILEMNVRLQSGHRLQIVPDFDDLPSCQRGQSAAFVVSNEVLVVWESDPNSLFKSAQRLHNALAKSLCGNGDDDEEEEEDEEDKNEKDYHDNSSIKVRSNELTASSDSFTIFEDPIIEHRQTKLWQAVYTAASVMLLTTAIGSGWRQVAIEQVQEPNWLRFLFLICFPAQFWLSLFFFQAIIGNIVQIFGSTCGMQENSKYYSGKPPRRIQSMYLHDTNPIELPHVTIQMPVYKESLKAVIEPTIYSIKRAIATYELQGGTANIFVNDDGMQLISEEEAEARQEFYGENSIGWVARPGHNTKLEGESIEFIRRGKFKKASNMNYALQMSVRVEELLMTVERDYSWDQEDENAVYEEALKTALSEREGEAWADGNIRVGDYILLIDSDTRVPTDCLLDAVSELEQSPQVAILQYSSGVMNVTDSFFERGITFFTNMIYTMIRFAVANGDVAPFVGHNAFLRWSAVQEVSYQCGHDHCEKFWSESTVSEDFDMTLRLQSEGYHTRLAAYMDDGYKEGVSLTVYDELARWEKYAYGCNELIFHPLKDWLHKGPITPLFYTFLGSPIPFSSKITILSYIGTYYALGSAWLLSLLNYFLVSFFNGRLDHYYMSSFSVLLAIFLVFSVTGNLALAWLRYRLHDRALLPCLLTNLKWIPLLTIFLGGLSLHISMTLLCHFFALEVEWGATTKEVATVGFLEAMGHVLRRFRWAFAFCGVVGVGMVVCGFGLGEEWRIGEVVAVLPLALLVGNHALLPVVLNPEIMRLTW
ncbi:hypothetical protein IQ07DRAFT_528002 [Pyrenochaeta sp. DS3sAY3a]|nr:hypothetical protein IQ07DRAFT_528002 [Pyrenochaeta sp. DS3sAY3a]